LGKRRDRISITYMGEENNKREVMLPESKPLRIMLWTINVNVNLNKKVNVIKSLKCP